jgi:hypothetical protein
METSVDFQVFILLGNFYALPISGNTMKGLHKQLADITTMINIQELKNYVFHVFWGKFTQIPQTHVVFHG